MMNIDTVFLKSNKSGGKVLAEEYITITTSSVHFDDVFPLLFYVNIYI